MNSILAAILSLLIPGLGQILIGDTRRGLVIFIVFAIACAVSSITVQSRLLPANFWIILPGLVALLAAWDAYKLATG
jgi:TM2 domain-containing membrane protein YozV